MHKIRRLLFLASLAFAGCACPDAQRASADLATYEWFAPIMTAYVTADPALDEAAKRIHLRALQAWGERVAADAKARGLR
jgi:hypothetical protein